MSVQLENIYWIFNAHYFSNTGNDLTTPQKSYKHCHHWSAAKVSEASGLLLFNKVFHKF